VNAAPLATVALLHARQVAAAARIGATAHRDLDFTLSADAKRYADTHSGRPVESPAPGRPEPRRGRRAPSPGGSPGDGRGPLVLHVTSKDLR
jgi:hypothetical protein